MKDLTGSTQKLCDGISPCTSLSIVVALKRPLLQTSITVNTYDFRATS